MLNFFYVLITLFSINLYSDTQVIAILDWCPQICPNNQQRPGFIYEIADVFFKRSKIKTKFVTLPWLRAINDVKKGKAIALLSPTKKEAPTLLYPQESIGVQNMCFYTRADSKWKFINESSIHKNFQVLAVEKTSLVNIEEFAKKNKSIFHYLSPSTKVEKRLVRMLLNKRADTFLFTKITTDSYIKSMGLTKEVKLAGCLDPELLYMPFSPKTPKESKRLMTLFDKVIKKMKKDGAIDKIMKRYY